MTAAPGAIWIWWPTLLPLCKCKAGLWQVLGLDRALQLFRRTVGQYRMAWPKMRVALYRRLAAEQPAAFETWLIRGLHALCSACEAAGDFEKALSASEEEALSLIGSNPPHHKQRELAWGLIHRSRSSRELGRWREGLEDERKAVALLSRRRSPHREIALELAAAHHELGICMHLAGRFEEAATATAEAVAIFRELSQEPSTTFSEDLASALNSLGNHQHAPGQAEDALGSTQEALELLQQARRQRPEGFNPTFASTLNNLALRLYSIGRAEEALDPARQAVKLYRTHREVCARSSHYMANSLHNLGTILDTLDQAPQAFELLEEAVELRRGLLHQNYDPNAAADLATSLTNLGKLLAQQGNPETAAQTTLEAVDLFRWAVAEGLEYLKPQLATALSNLAHQASEQGRWQDSVAAAEEAVRLLAPFS